MRWESKVLSPNQMLSSCLCFFKIIPSPSWIFVLPTALISLVFATYLVPGFGFLSVFLYTSLVLVLSTFFCSSTALNHHKAACVVGETEFSMEESSDQREDTAEAKEEEEEEEEKQDDDNNGDKEKTSYYAEESSDRREDISEAKEEEDEVNNGGGSGVHNNNDSARSPDSLSNSESHLQEMSTSMEYDELYDYRPLDQSTDSSDGSISDEESLIEIALPSPTGHCSLKHHQQQQKHSLTMMSELLAEYNFDMNEEDNLIEIDISMGSIKSYPSRFEIQA